MTALPAIQGFQRESLGPMRPPNNAHRTLGPLPSEGLHTSFPLTSCKVERRAGQLSGPQMVA